ncbi:MAG: DUF3048 domain-containing protein [Candidatus Saccharimonadales bacterium]
MDDQFKPDHIKKDAGQFRTPEQVAAMDQQSPGSPLLIHNALDKESPDMTKHKKRRFKLWPPNKITVITAAVLIILIGGSLFWFFTRHKPTTNAPIIKAQVQKPTTVASSLTGLQVSPATNKLPITAVIIENSLQARPQSGLSQAGVVFEALAEGGITRYLALFQSDSPSLTVGPVRSARPYFLSWLLGFDAAFAHVGGSPEALADISSWGVKNMDQFYNGDYYQRISSRQAPHNVYTTLASLYKLEQNKGFTSSNFTSWARKTPQPLKNPTAKSISLALSGPDYNVSYTYNQPTNSYNRDVGGVAQTDANTNQQISPTVVIAIVVPESNGSLDSSGAYYSVYQTIGSGTAYVFQDGGVTVGQWSKSSNNSQIQFTTSNGQPLALDPGETWVTAVASNSAVSY